VVLVAAVAAGIAVFGRNPVPQPATGGGDPDTSPVAAPRRGGSDPDRSVVVPTSVRVRSAVLLLVASIALAGFIGVVGSIVVVAIGLVIG